MTFDLTHELFLPFWTDGTVLFRVNAAFIEFCNLSILSKLFAWTLLNPISTWRILSFPSWSEPSRRPWARRWSYRGPCTRPPAPPSMSHRHCRLHKYRLKSNIAQLNCVNSLKKYFKVTGHSIINFIVGLPHQYKHFLIWHVPLLNARVSGYLDLKFYNLSLFAFLWCKQFVPFWLRIFAIFLGPILFALSRFNLLTKISPPPKKKNPQPKWG